MHLRPYTDAGRRFVELAESHLEDFRSRAAGHDADSTFVADNFADLKSSGLIAAFVPAEVGGLDL